MLPIVTIEPTAFKVLCRAEIPLFCFIIYGKMDWVRIIVPITFVENRSVIVWREVVKNNPSLLIAIRDLSNSYGSYTCSIYQSDWWTNHIHCFFYTLSRDK